MNISEADKELESLLRKQALLIARRRRAPQEKRAAMYHKEIELQRRINAIFDKREGLDNGKEIAIIKE